MKFCIHWIFGLELMQYKIINSILNSIPGAEIVILATTPSLAAQAGSIFGESCVLCCPPNFTQEMARPEVQNLIKEKGLLLSHAERNLSNQLYEVDEQDDVAVELIRRAAFFSSYILDSGGLFIAEYCTDILTTMICLLARENSDVKYFSVQGARLHPKSEKIPFFIGGELEWPRQSSVSANPDDRALLADASKRTLDLLSTSLGREDVYPAMRKRPVSRGATPGPKANIRTTVFLPLQVYPENSSLGLALGAGTQEWIVELIARALPVGARLLVKRHFVANSARDFDESCIKRSPSTELVANDVRVSEILQASDLVITLNNTVGLEALSRGLPVIVQGDCFYSGLDGVFRLDLESTSIKLLRETIYRALSFRFNPAINMNDKIKVLLDEISNHSILDPDYREFPATETVASAVSRAVEQCSAGRYSRYGIPT